MCAREREGERDSAIYVRCSAMQSSKNSYYQIECKKCCAKQNSKMISANEWKKRELKKTVFFFVAAAVISGCKLQSSVAVKPTLRNDCMHLKLHV